MLEMIGYKLLSYKDCDKNQIPATEFAKGGIRQTNGKQKDGKKLPPKDSQNTIRSRRNG
jgi:hypothetical protein